MEEVPINTSHTVSITLPSDPDGQSVTVDLTHEFGDTVDSGTAATRTGVGAYEITYGQNASGLYTLDAAGAHRVDFTYAMSGTTYTYTEYIYVYSPYLTWEEFVAQHPELSGQEVNYSYFEKRARSTINTFCGQNFNDYPNKSITIDGSNHTNLHLPLPIYSLTKVTANSGDVDVEVLHDSTDSTLNNIEKVRQPFNFESAYFIRFKSKTTQNNSARIFDSTFKSSSDYTIEGSFGWRYVPTNIKQAADLLVLDYMNDDSEYRRHGITSVDIDTARFTMHPDFSGSTGNIEVDVLLTDYTLFVMDYVI